MQWRQSAGKFVVALDDPPAIFAEIKLSETCKEEETSICGFAGQYG